MAQKPKRELSQKRYDEVLKRKIAKEYIAEEASYQVLANEYGLKNKDVVKEFVRWYKRIIAKESEQIEMKKEKPDLDKEQEGSKNHEELLEIIAHERLRNEMLEALINEANKSLRINIKKNFGTKL